MLKFQVGMKTRFQYPTSNNINCPVEWRDREILTTKIRRLSREPLLVSTVQAKPFKRRGDVLIYGIDQETGKERQFYLSAMRGFEADVELQLVAVDNEHPEDSPEPLGRCFALNSTELGILNEMLLRLRGNIDLPSNYSLRIMPIEVSHD